MNYQQVGRTETAPFDHTYLSPLEILPKRTHLQLYQTFAKKSKIMFPTLTSAKITEGHLQYCQRLLVTRAVITHLSRSDGSELTQSILSQGLL